MNLTIIIPGVPVGKGRPKFARRGAFVQTYTPEKTASYENLVKVCAAESMKKWHIEKPFEGAVYVELHALMPVPKSWSKRKTAEAHEGSIRPLTKPDADNVLKCIADACNEIVWKDDSQIVDARVVKRFVNVLESPCAIVKVWE